MRPDDMPGWSETDAERLHRYASDTRIARANYIKFAIKAMPSDEVGRAIAMVQIEEAEERLKLMEKQLRNEVRAQGLHKEHPNAI